MLAGPKSLLILRPTTPAIHRNLRFEPVARTSYAPTALHTTNIQPEHGLERAVGSDCQLNILMVSSRTRAVTIQLTPDKPGYR